MILLFFVLTAGYANTRWSSLQTLPDADVLQSGTYVLDLHGFSLLEDISDATPGFSLDLGFSDRVNLQLGYVGEFNLGFKALLLSEAHPLLPSVTIGMQNLFSSRDEMYFDIDNDSFENEFFLAFGKNINSLRTRIHFGMLSAASSREDRFNPFLGIEKYFGAGIYLTTELQRKSGYNCISVLTSWRFLRDAVELSVGLVDILQMFPDSEYETFMSPGLRVSLKYRGVSRLGSMKGVQGIEERFLQTDKLIEQLRTEIDTLRYTLNKTGTDLDSLNQFVLILADSVESDERRMELFVTEKLTALKVLYEQEPFEPALVQTAARELVSYRDRIVPHLMDKVLDRTADPKIRTISVSLLGEIGNRMASDVLLEILSHSKDPEIRIEALIALGKMKETRAGYLIQVLTTDPNDAVAFTASEVLRKLQEETGIDFRSSSVTEHRDLQAVSDEQTKENDSDEWFVEETKLSDSDTTGMSSENRGSDESEHTEEASAEEEFAGQSGDQEAEQGSAGQ
ncbi:hypothetical protein CHISP_2395 [Chitinispirillum alkaliphilum]|nr:hypothetical protein CHISP_2395 [Chitinispirillum alkaliphilum]